MRALVITAPGTAEVQDVEAPRAGAGAAVVRVHRVGICGTDVELFQGTMPYVVQGRTTFPIRPGHEWCGQVEAVGDGVDPAWVGRRVTGDTMVGCASCARCRSGRQHLCETRSEVGVLDGLSGALAEQVAVPVRALVTLPDTVDETAGALIEPTGNAVRALRAAAVEPGESLLVLGAGTIGLLVALLAQQRGVRVHLVDRSGAARDFARSLGLAASDDAGLPGLLFDAVVDASTGSDVPARAVQLTEPGRNLVCIGIAGSPSLVDTREVTMRNVSLVGVLSASGGLDEAIACLSGGELGADRIVASTVGLEQAAAVLAGERPGARTNGPKIHVDPR